jgi:uncharacterized iron-regulated membrane protein
MKVFFRRIHLYLSLGAGLVIMLCCFTGAMLVFQKELEQVFHKSRYVVKAEEQKLSLDSLVSNVKKNYPQAKINGIRLYDDPTRSAEVSVLIQDKKEEASEAPPTVSTKGKDAAKKAPRGGRVPSLTAFVNPYTGQVLDLHNPREGFFYSMLALHRWLLGSNDGIGKYITGISTFIFLFILITGIILWWPKTKKILSQRLKVKWNSGWKRLNHDLHIVLGFYSFLVLFIFAFTALAWSFQWFNKGIYQVTSSSMKAPEPPTSTYVDNVKTIGFDKALFAAQNSFTNVVYYNITMPRDSAGAVTVTALSKDAVHETASDALYIDQYSGNVLGQYLFSDRNLGARVRATFRPVHVGSIWGTPSKIIALIACLLGTSFPITGTILWINRTRKSKKKVKQVHREVMA